MTHSPANGATDTLDRTPEQGSLQTSSTDTVAPLKPSKRSDASNANARMHERDATQRASNILTSTNTKGKPTKKAVIQRLLERKTGATMDALVEATGWQPHSLRAALSGIRKSELVLKRGKNRKGTTVYSIKAPEHDAAQV